MTNYPELDEESKERVRSQIFESLEYSSVIYDILKDVEEGARCADCLKIKIDCLCNL